MTHLIEFPLEDGNVILIEVDESDTEGGSLVPASRGKSVIRQATQNFEDALNIIRPAATTIINKIRSLHDRPDEIEVEFALKVSADAGAFVAMIGAEANYKVTLKWRGEYGR